MYTTLRIHMFIHICCMHIYLYIYIYIYNSEEYVANYYNLLDSLIKDINIFL